MQLILLVVIYVKSFVERLVCLVSDYDKMVICICDKIFIEIMVVFIVVNFEFVDYFYWSFVVDKNFFFDSL